jgi:hypothetical protein
MKKRRKRKSKETPVYQFVPPLPGPYDPDEESPDPGWVHYLHAWYDGDPQPLVDALRGHAPIPSDDRFLREFLADFVAGRVKRGRGKPKKPHNKTFVTDFDSIAWATVTKKRDSVTERARAAAVWVKEYEQKHGAIGEEVLKDAADKFKVHKSSLVNHLRRSKKARGAFSIKIPE